jgi:hypothetical protein
MNSSSLKQKMLALVRQTHDDLDALATGLTDDQKRAKGSLQLWSAKDIFTHLTFWGRHFNAQLEKSSRGEKIPVSGDYVDQINNGVFYENMDKSFESAFQEYEQVFQEKLKRVDGFIEEELTDPKKFAWLEGQPLINRILGNAVWHPQAHLADYYAKRGKLELATQMQENLTEKLRDFPTWSVTAVYNLACFYALNGMQDKSIAGLKESFNERSDLVEWSKQDSDLNSLRESPEFKALYK